MSDSQTDREMIIRGCEYWVKNHKDESLPLAYSSVVELLALLKEQEVVRCKDCKWAEVSDNEHTWCDHVDHEFCHGNDWFCADGERKEGR